MSNIVRLTRPQPKPTTLGHQLAAAVRRGVLSQAQAEGLARRHDQIVARSFVENWDSQR
jgi:hypothetical protein